MTLGAHMMMIPTFIINLNQILPHSESNRIEQAATTILNSHLFIVSCHIRISMLWEFIFSSKILESWIV